MTGNELYQLIHSLDRREKSNFAKFTDSNAGFNQGGKRPRYLRLFDRMARMKVYDEDAVRGDLFRSAVKFYQAREKLLDKIIQSLVYFGGQKLSARSYILQALKVDAFDLAQRRLNAELKTAKEEQDIDYYHYLLTLKERIETSYRIKVDLQDGLEDISDIGPEYGHVLKLRGILRRLLMLIRSDPKAKSELGAQQFLDELQEIPLSGPESHYLYNKILSCIKITQLEMQAAFSYQQIAVRELEKMGSILKNGRLAQEYFFLVQLSRNNNDLKTVQHTIFKFSQIHPENRFEQELKHDYWVQAAISAGHIHGNLDLIKEAMPILMENLSLFSHDLLILNLFFAAKVYFIHEEYSSSLEIIDQIRSMRKCKWAELNWAIETLRLLNHAEREHFEVLESVFRSSLRLGEALDADLPRLSTRMIHRMACSSGHLERAQIREEYLKIREKSTDSPSRKISLDLLDLSFWFDHKATSDTLLICYQNSTDLNSSNSVDNSSISSPG